LLNPNLLKLHYRERARAKGVRFLDRHLLREAEISSGGVSLGFEKLSGGISDENKVALYSSLESDVPGKSSVRIHADRVVNCAGPWAKEVARILGYFCPSYSVRRQ